MVSILFFEIYFNIDLNFSVNSLKRTGQPAMKMKDAQKFLPETDVSKERVNLDDLEIMNSNNESNKVNLIVLF